MRVIFLLLIILVIWRMVKIHQARKAASSSSPKELTQQKMVRCRLCNVHLPEAEALQAEEQWFCSEAHKRQHLQGQ